MNILQAIINKFPKHEKRYAEYYDDELLGKKTNAGVPITETSAMRLAAHYACVSLVARVVASFPVHLFESLPNGGKRKADDHPVYRLLHDQPNPEMTPYVFKEVMQANLSNVGKAFAEIVWGRDGYPKELWPIPPALVQPQRNKDGKLEYLVNGSKVPGWKILHIPGLGFDGLNSFSPVGLFREQIGLGLAAEQYGARFFGQGTNIGGFIEYPTKLTEEAYKRLKASMDEKYRGLQNSHGTIILEEGAKYTKIGMSMEDAQFIETQKLNRATIAMIHGVPPHLIGDLERATFSNIEQQGIEAVVYLFRPWAVRWEQALTARLLTQDEQRRYYIRFNLDGLLRGDIKSRYDAYAVARQWGWMNVNDIRSLEEMDPIGPQGEIYLQPMNMVPASKQTERAVKNLINAQVPMDTLIDISKSMAESMIDGLRANPVETVRTLYRCLEDLFQKSGYSLVSRSDDAYIKSVADSLRHRMSSTYILKDELHRVRCALLRNLYKRAGFKFIELIPGNKWRDSASSATRNRIITSIDTAIFEKGQEIRDGNFSFITEYRVWNPPVFAGDDSEIIPYEEE